MRSSSEIREIAKVVMNSAFAGIEDSFEVRVVEALRSRLYDKLLAMVESKLTDFFLKKSKNDANDDDIVGEGVEPTELWSTSQREKANTAAMQILANKSASETTREDREALKLYSGWGGLSDGLKKAVKSFPSLDLRSVALIHEFYTPVGVVNEVVRTLLPMLADLPRGTDGNLWAMEPSAGIGRFVRAFPDKVGQVKIRWSGAEYSAISASILERLRPDMMLHKGPFEVFVQEQAPDLFGQLGLVVSNPPYGVRGAEIVEDRDVSYRRNGGDRIAYYYFMRRSLDLLAKGGVGVFLIPAGFISGKGDDRNAMREAVIRRHHLLAAYRLPSDIFPGAKLVTDLLFFEARGGTVVGQLEPYDQQVVNGQYFERHIANILGEERVPNGSNMGSGRDQAADDQTKKPSWRYEVVGDFSALPDWSPKPIHDYPEVELLPRPKRPLVIEPETEEGQAIMSATALGDRFERFLRLIAEEDVDPRGVQSELRDSFQGWVALYGDPHLWPALKRQAGKAGEKLNNFFAAFAGRSTKLTSALATPATWPPKGRNLSIVSVAETNYRGVGFVNADSIRANFPKGSEPSDAQIELELVRAGWSIDLSPTQGRNYQPEDVYYFGDLWAKLDSIESSTEPLLKTQAQRLRDAIGVGTTDFEGIELDPRMSWVPLDVIEDWIMTLTQEDDYSELYSYSSLRPKNYGSLMTLTRKSGVVFYQNDRNGAPLTFDDMLSLDSRHAILALGFINHDLAMFRPNKSDKHRGVTHEQEGEGSVNIARANYTKFLLRHFTSFVKGTSGVVERIRPLYERANKGFIKKAWSAEPVFIERWNKAITLHGYQNQEVRRLAVDRKGLTAFDVGLGKTFTGLATMALAKQQGWARRVVVCVPNSLAWNWAAEAQRALPDYRFVVIGTSRHIATRGKNKGQFISTEDTREQRVSKWRRLQAGEVDFAIVTYTAFQRTTLRSDEVRAYVEEVDAIMRSVAIQRRQAAGKKKMTPRDEAILQQGVGAWVAQVLEPPSNWGGFDPVIWADLGVNMVIVDEAQNFKNLFLPDNRGGGTPRYLGNSGDGSDRAWQMDFRLASVRRSNIGQGVILLSATPAKNSPLEFYNLTRYVDSKLWDRAGIYDPEQFISRFCEMELETGINISGEVEDKLAVRGFKNLDELRDIVFRHASFRNAKEVGLKIPKPKYEDIVVDMDERQTTRYGELRDMVRDALEDGGPMGSTILRAVSAMAFVAVHADLDKNVSRRDEGFKYENAAAALLHDDGRYAPEFMMIDGVRTFVTDGGSAVYTPRDGVDPASPKLVMCATTIRKMNWCAHVVFCESTAIHVWLKELLVRLGMDGERIAIMNSKAADGAKRQQIAVDFNGDVEGGIEPKYDVVIGNVVMSEGVNLQTRTCAIHHIDLPWEPSTIQQRNGRGVRQGNKADNVRVLYYLSARSFDGYRRMMIDGKKAWIDSLVYGRDKSVANDGAETLSKEDLLVMMSDDPQAARQAFEIRRATLERQRKLSQHLRASEDAIKANSAFTKARTAERQYESLIALTQDPEWIEETEARAKAKILKDKNDETPDQRQAIRDEIESATESMRLAAESNARSAKKHRAEGESLLDSLETIDDKVWPWKWMHDKIRTEVVTAVVSPERRMDADGTVRGYIPLWPGARIVNKDYNIEFGSNTLPIKFSTKMGLIPARRMGGLFFGVGFDRDQFGQIRHEDYEDYRKANGLLTLWNEKEDASGVEKSLLGLTATNLEVYRWRAAPLKVRNDWWTIISKNLISKWRSQYAGAKSDYPPFVEDDSSQIESYVENYMPLTKDGALVLGNRVVFANGEYKDEDVVPPTLDGFELFKDLAADAPKIPWSDLNRTSIAWFGVPFPQGKRRKRKPENKQNQNTRKSINDALGDM